MFFCRIYRFACSCRNASSECYHFRSAVVYQLKNNQNSLTKFSCVDLNIYEVFSDQFFAYFYSPSYMVHCCSVLTVISNVVVRWGYWLLPIIIMVSHRDPLLLFHCCWASFLHTDLEFSRNGEKTRMLSNNMSLVCKN